MLHEERPITHERRLATVVDAVLAVLVPARLCRRFRLDLAGPDCRKPRGFVSPRAAGPVRMRLTRRG